MSKTRLHVEIRGVRAYDGVRAPESSQVLQSSFHWLLTWGSKQSRSQAFRLREDGFTASPPESACYATDFSVPESAVEHSMLKVNLFILGGGGGGGVDGAPEDDDRSLHDLTYVKVAAADVPLEGVGDGIDGWFACRSSHGDVVWGVFVRVAAFLEGQSSVPNGPCCIPSSARKQPVGELIDQYGFPVRPEMYAEYKRACTLRQLRDQEVLLMWERRKAQWGKAKRKERSGERKADGAGVHREGPTSGRASSGVVQMVEEDEGMRVLRQLVWEGVPEPLRQEAYARAIGLEEKRAATQHQCCYKKLSQAASEPNLGLGPGVEGDLGDWVCVGNMVTIPEAASSNEMSMPELTAEWGAGVAAEVEIDIGRAFSEGKTAINTPEGAAKLRRVLRAYALRNPAVGYCQGMNFIAGLLLLAVDEETAFWALAHFCEDVNPMCYSPPMLGTKADLAALQELLEDQLPALWAHCDSMHLQLNLLAATWLLIYFINVFPPASALRVLEVAMVEGSDVTFSVTLAFFRSVEAELLLCQDLNEVLEVLKSRQSAMFDIDPLLHESRKLLDEIRPFLRLSRAWNLNNEIRERKEISGHRRVVSLNGGEHPEKRLRRMLYRSFFVGRQLLDLPFSAARQATRRLDRPAFTATQRLALETRYKAIPFRPMVVRLLQWFWGWKVLSRRTGELENWPRNGGGSSNGGSSSSNGSSVGRASSESSLIGH